MLFNRYNVARTADLATATRAPDSAAYAAVDVDSASHRRTCSQPRAHYDAQDV
jgi:hypothetical protein